MMKIKKMISGLLCAVLFLSTLSGFEVAAGQGSATYYTWSEITSYRENQKAPTMDGYMFAGWYEDEACKDYLEPEKVVSGAYAKFVEEATLSAKGQITEGTTAESQITALRILTSVDSLHYQNVGFQMEVNGKVQTITSKTVYEQVRGYTKNGTEYYTPQETFSNDSLYFMTYEITDVPQVVYGTGFVVTPMWTTLDGIVVTGRTQTLNIYSGMEGRQAVDKLSYGELWSAPSTVKIMNTGSSDDCAVSDTVTAQSGVSYNAVKNEYESVQLILSANQAVSSFALYANDLKNGNERILAENVEVYQQKYINYDDTAHGYGSGSMPDALLPMDAAVSYDENNIQESQNGSLWVTIYIPKDAKAGTYEGTFMFVVDGAGDAQVIEVPVYLEVKDYTLSDEATAKTLFSWRYERVGAGELDGSFAMMKEYYEFYQDYRISLQSLPLGSMSGAEVKKALKEYGDICSTFTILGNNIGDITLGAANNTKNFKEQILAIAEACDKEHNYFTKAMCYSWDEANMDNSGVPEYMTTLYNTRISVLKECIAEIKADTAGKYDGLTQYHSTEWESSILNILDVLPISQESAQWIVEHKNDTVIVEFLKVANCLCPQFQVAGESYYTELQALCDSYGITLWWYGCFAPQAPYPTYHISDTNLLSARSVSWLQNKYDIQGNLYWDASAYTMTQANNNNDQYTNVYDNPVRCGGSIAGDGNLTYPGAAYGVYGALPSIRLMSIRDGMEEYEILCDVEEAFEKKAGDFRGIANIDVDATMDSIFYKPLYSEGMQMNADGTTLNFSGLRSKLLNMVVTLDKGLGYASSEITYSKESTIIPNLYKNYKATFSCYVQNGSTMKINGVSYTSGQSYVVKGSSTYSEVNTSVTIEVTNAAGETCTYTKYVGNGPKTTAQTGTTGVAVPTQGVVKTEKKYNAQENSELLLSFDNYANVTGTAIQVTKLFGEGKINTDSQFITEGTGSWMVRPEGDYGSDTYPWIKMRCTDSTFATDNFENYKTVLMDVYNDSDEEVCINWGFTASRYDGVDYGTETHTYVLAPNTWTTCEYDFSDPMYENLYDLTNPIKYMTITFMDKKQSMDDATSALYFDNLRAVKADAPREQLQYSFANGVDFEKETDLSLFKINEGGDSGMSKARVAYSDTNLAASAANLGLGQYGLKADATGSIWPRMMVKFDQQYVAGKILSFWLYVETDEDVVAGNTYSMAAGNQISGTPIRIVNGRCQYNSWVKVNIELTEATELMYYYVNFDTSAGVSMLGDHKVNIYMDNFRIVDTVEGDSVTVDTLGTVSMKTLDGERQVQYTYEGTVEEGDTITFNLSVLPNVKTMHIWVLGGTGDVWDEWSGDLLENVSGPISKQVKAKSNADGFRILVSFDVEGDLSQYTAIIEQLRVGGSLSAEDSGDGDSTTLGDLFK